MNDDDSELFISHSSEKRFKNTEQAKQEQREQNAKSKGKLASLKRLLFSGTLEDQGMSDAEADEETKRLREVAQNDDQDKTFGTKTHMEMEQEEALDAKTDFSPEQLQQMAKDEEEEKKQTGQEYAGDEA